MRTKQSYLAEAKARAVNGAAPRAASPFEWEDWHRYRRQNEGRLAGLKVQRRQFLK